MRILLTDGEWSDYSVIALLDVPSREWLREKLRARYEMAEGDHVMRSDWLQWLGAQSECQVIEYEEYWLVDGSCWPPDPLG